MAFIQSHDAKPFSRADGTGDKEGRFAGAETAFAHHMVRISHESMRAELTALILQSVELDVWHFRQTLELCDKLNESHWQYTHAPFADGDMSDQEYVEVLADQNIRTALETHYIWQFGLWRLQAIFEGLLNQDFLHAPKLLGLASKLKRLKTLGFSLSPTEEDDLSAWAALRNALSHRPVQAASLGQQLYRDDLEEVAALYTRLIERWRIERDDLPALDGGLRSNDISG